MGLFRKSGLPSESTLCRLEKSIDDEKLADALSGFAHKSSQNKKSNYLRAIAIDGKCMRGTIQDDGRAPNIVGAYSVDDQRTVATVLCDKKSNEIKAGPKLIDKVCNLYDGESNIVFTADAMQCQSDFIKKIIEHKTHFLVEVKSNQKALRWGLEDNMKTTNDVGVYSEDATLSHGRIESRICKKYRADNLGVDTTKWGKSLIVISIETFSIQKNTGAQSRESRIYLTDLDMSPKILNDIARKHWAIESMHWTLDTTMGQDRIRRKSIRSARNLDNIQRLCLSILSIWRSARRKLSDKAKGATELLRKANQSFQFMIELLELNAQKAI